MKKELTVDRVRELLNYDDRTGVFNWRVNCRRARAGQVAGSIKGDDGYSVIMIDYVAYYSHRLAWFFVYGEWPSSDIDHRNTDRSDNRLENLRLATKTQNQRNRRRAKSNASGVKGVCWHKQSKKWRASIKDGAKQRIIGCYDTLEEARAAYEATALREFGEFARVA